MMVRPAIRRVQLTNDFTPFPIEEVGQSTATRFEKIVQQYPDRLAVKMGDRSLTYDQLNQTANRIAHTILEKRGTGSEPIALLFDHGIDVIAAILAVLKAGKFYVPLDTSWPRERIKCILKDSDSTMLVTNDHNWNLITELQTEAGAILSIDSINYSVSDQNPGLSVSSEDPLSVLYTSGSTGEPKGVIHIHKMSGASSIDLGVVPSDRLSLLHSVSFGSATTHLLSSLLNGASLFPFSLKLEGAVRLARYLREEQITLLHASPAMFRQLGDILAKEEKLTTLRIITLSGAPITRQDFELYKNHFPETTLLRLMMGSTEGGGLFGAVVDHRFSFPAQGTPLGYPRGGRQVLLLDESGHKVNPGEIGEITVKGSKFHASYLNRPKLTRAKFLPDTDGGDAQIYLTGDLGKMLPDGFLIHLGRKDMMIKIRGYRVEIGEIECALLSHSAVKDACVAAWDREVGEKYLVAYVVARENLAPKVEELRGFLGEKLPDYMIPSVFMFIDSLPLNNGKLDRKALPKPEHKRPDLRTPYAPPRTETERKLVAIWEGILDVRPVGVNDDFFDLAACGKRANKRESDWTNLSTSV
jgi:amino acid adenylation domain-containing protein